MSDLYGTGASNQPDTHSGFNDRTPPNDGFAPWGSDGNVYPANADFALGVDLATLVDLPQDLRGRAIGALQALANARALGNKQAEDTAAAALAEIVQEIQRVKNEATATKVFAASGQTLPASSYHELHKAMHSERDDKDDAKVVEAVLSKRA